MDAAIHQPAIWRRQNAARRTAQLTVCQHAGLGHGMRMPSRLGARKGTQGHSRALFALQCVATHTGLQPHFTWHKNSRRRDIYWVIQKSPSATLSICLSQRMNPRMNQCLETLPDSGFELLSPRLRLISLPANEILYEAFSQPDTLYFPTNALIAIRKDTPDGLSIGWPMTCLSPMRPFRTPWVSGARR